jgi:phage terminase small subunit
MHPPLTPKETRFVQQYLIALNATDAYQAAGFKATGHSARVHASKLLQKPRVAAAIAAGQAAVAAKAGLTAEIVLARLLARLIEPIPNVKDLFDGDNLKPMSQLTREEAAIIASFEVVKKNLEAGDGKTDIVHKVKALELRAVQIKAIELGLRHLGLLHDKQEVNITSADARIARLVAARKRTS